MSTINNQRETHSTQDKIVKYVNEIPGIRYRELLRMTGISLTYLTILSWVEYVSLWLFIVDIIPASPDDFSEKKHQRIWSLPTR